MGLMGNVASFIVIAVGGGLGSAWYMVEAGSPLSTVTAGPWTTWTMAGRPDADPYTRAHLARRGDLASNTSIVHTFVATTDPAGERLVSSCEYAVEGRGPTAAWWSLAVFDQQGRLISNPLGRFAYNSVNVMRAADGGYLITLARDARPGSWLPTGTAGRIALVLTVQQPRASDGQVVDGVDPQELPTLRRIGCR